MFCISYSENLIIFLRQPKMHVLIPPNSYLQFTKFSNCISRQSKKDPKNLFSLNKNVLKNKLSWQIVLHLNVEIPGEILRSKSSSKCFRHAMNLYTIQSDQNLKLMYMEIVIFYYSLIMEYRFSRFQIFYGCRFMINVHFFVQFSYFALFAFLASIISVFRFMYITPLTIVILRVLQLFDYLSCSFWSWAPFFVLNGLSAFFVHVLICFQLVFFR